MDGFGATAHEMSRMCDRKADDGIARAAILTEARAAL
jgi:hypothetical protein